MLFGLISIALIAWALYLSKERAMQLQALEKALAAAVLGAPNLMETIKGLK